MTHTTTRTPFSVSSSPSLFSSWSGGWDLLFTRALGRLPLPLLTAMRESGIDDPAILLHYPRATTEEFQEGSREGSWDVGFGSLRAPLRRHNPLFFHAARRSRRAELRRFRRRAASLDLAVSTAVEWVLKRGGDPRTDQMRMTSSPLRGELATQTATSPESVRRSPASNLELEKSSGHDVRDALTCSVRDGSGAKDENSTEVAVTGSGLAGDAMTELATPKTAQTARVVLSLADKLLSLRFAVGDNVDKNSRGCSEVSVHAVDGHCMSADQPGQYGLRSDTRVDGHPVSLSDRILAKRFSITALAEGKIDVHRDGYRSQAKSEKAKMVRRRDGSVGQEVADGS